MSQFHIMGNYMDRLRPELWAPVKCAEKKKMVKEHQLCRDFVVPGIHLGWKSSYYVKGDKCGADGVLNLPQEQNAFPRFGKRFGMT